MSFPLDDATLVMLAAACELNEDTGRTHLMDFLAMGERVATEEDITDDVFPDGGPMVVERTFEPGFEPYSPHDAIKALVAEVQRLRALVGEQA